jgi:hypothetical protein
MDFKRFWYITRRVPFTLIMLVALLTGALATNSHMDELSSRWLNRLGFAPSDLWFWRWERLFSSALVTNGGWVFGQALAMVALVVGVAEWLAGTRRAIVTFWGIHLLTLIIESLLIAWPLHLLGSPFGTSLAVAGDVGPSAGYFGCLGLACARFPQRRWGQATGLFIFTGLGWAMLQPARAGEDRTVKFSADLAHLLAFPLGWLSSYVAFRKTR